MGVRRLNGERPDGQILLIVPALNQENDIAAVVETARRLRYGVCVVDDASTDRTADRAEDAGAQVLRMPRTLGPGAALRCGFRWAVEHGYQSVLQADAYVDLGQVPAIVDTMEAAEADMAVVSLRTRDSVLRRWAMKLLSVRIARAGGRRILQPTSELRVTRGPLLDRFAADYPAEYHTVAALVEAGRMGANIMEVLVPESSAGRDSTLGLRYLMKAILAVELMPKAPLAPLRVLRAVPPANRAAPTA
jgi:hypothetical protein